MFYGREKGKIFGKQEGAKWACTFPNKMSRTRSFAGQADAENMQMHATISPARRHFVASTFVRRPNTRNPNKFMSLLETEKEENSNKPEAKLLKF